MRQGPHNKRGRGRGGNNNRRSGTPNRNQTFDSNGPEVRIRGNANQVHEKYQNLARDAAQNGDRVLAESYFQHAEHYYRIISAFTDDVVGDPNRNRGNGNSSGYNNEGANGQFQEEEPQPELEQSSANIGSDHRPVQADEAPGQAETVVGIQPHSPAQAPEAELAEAQPVEKPIAKPRGRAPARRPLSLRRRRDEGDGGDEATVDSQSNDSADGAPTPSAEPVKSGVTVTVVGAPAEEVSEPAPAAPPRRRRPRAVQSEETPQDD